MDTKYIKINRQLLEWQWFSEANTFQLFMYLLLNASEEDNADFFGVPLKRGQLLTSMGKIIGDTWLTRAKLRTSISKLKRTEQITIEEKGKRLLVTICNYDEFVSAE